MGPTEQMANWIVNTTYDEMPAAAKRVAGETCFDCLGGMLAGSVQPLGRTIIDYGHKLGGDPEATVIPEGRRLSTPNAALVNGTLAHAMDFDDSSAFAHSASILLPALLALAEARGASGRELLEAYIIGHEVGEALTPRGKTGEYPFQKQPVIGRMGATAACAKLLRLDREQTRMALGIAGSMASGLEHNLGTMTNPLHAGLAARDGVMAAELAARGWTSGERILEHPLGFINAFMGPAFLGPAQNPQALAERLGNPYRIQDIVTLKKYPCGLSNHYTIDALLELMQEHHFGFRDVESVEVSQPYYSHYIDPVNERPRTGLQGKFSMVYNAAAALVLGKVDIDTFSDQRVKDPRIQETMDKIHVRVLSKWEIGYDEIEQRWPKGGTTGATGRPIVVRLKGGKVLSKAVVPGRLLGSQKNPWAFENIRDKFETNARLALPEHQVQAAVRVWSGPEQIKDIQEAIRCVVACQDVALMGTDGHGPA
ncbi:MAG: MmgE/PrpD family protein [Chloroflexi bacterium]|nr:MmgE/PrpD family protein [Chloroflexota bacterium]